MLTSFKQLIDQYGLKVNGIIHVGAHWGQEYKEYVTNGVTDIVFIEPCKAAFTRLISDVGLYPGVICVNKGCGAAEEAKEMYVEHDNQGQSNSLLKPKLHATQYPGIKFTDYEYVQIDTLDKIMLDSVYTEYPENRYDMLVMDTQGYEHHVLIGAFKTLRHINYIYTEVNRSELYEGCALVGALDAMLSDFERVNTNWAGSTWGDALYIRKKE